ncbi:MAG: amidohydrolase family protein [Propylenella sp.]
MQIVLEGGTLIDGQGGAPVANAAIVLERDRIKSVSDVADLPRQAVSPDVQSIDLAGKWILPGLINMHEHLYFREAMGAPRETRAKGRFWLTFFSLRNALTALARGWTTVRDMGTLHGISIEVRDLVNGGELPGPRIVACGSPVSITGGHGHGMCVEADGADTCRRAAREQLKAGADFLKLMASHDPIPMTHAEKTRPEMTLAEMRAVFDVAREWGRKTACHVMGRTAIGNVLDAGVDIIDHGIYLDDALAERMARQGTFLTPTLSAYCRQTRNPVFGRGAAWAAAHSVLVEPHIESLRAAVKAGVKMLNGTDSTGVYAEDVEMMREAGMRPMDTILACTRNAAEALALEDRIGTIAPGKIADIVVLDSDPLEDAYALEAVHLVIKGGAVYRPHEISFFDSVAPGLSDAERALARLAGMQHPARRSRGESSRAFV